MRTVTRRLINLERHSAIEANPRLAMRFVFTHIGRPLNWATSKCQRWLVNDELWEYLNLDGNRERPPITEAELDAFAARFPIQPRHGRIATRGTAR